MRKTATAITFVVILLLTPAATAESRRTLDATGFDAAGEYWFEYRGIQEKNPPIKLAPGEEVWVDFRSQGREDHNIHFGGPIEEVTELATSGHSMALLFTVPDEPGEYEYWCDPHRELGMRGTYRIEEETPDQAASPFVGVLPVLLLAALLTLGRRHLDGGPP